MTARLFFLSAACFFIASFAMAEDCQKAVDLYNSGTLSQDVAAKETLFKQAIPLCSDPDVLGKVYNNLADTYQTKGMLSAALVYYRKAIETNKDLATAYASVGDIFGKLGDHYSAYVMYGKALQNRPGDEEILNGREKASEEFKKKMVIYFDRNSFQISENYLYRLELVGESARDGRRIEIAGYTCDIGSKTLNRKLSLRRAEAAACYLRSHYPINKNAITVRGKGKSNPLLPGRDEESRMLNRRVEIRVIFME